MANTPLFGAKVDQNINFVLKKKHAPARTHFTQPARLRQRNPSKPDRFPFLQPFGNKLLQYFFSRSHCRKKIENRMRVIFNQAYAIFIPKFFALGSFNPINAGI